MKRILSVLLAAVLILSLAACGEKQTVGETPAGDESMAEETAPAPQTAGADETPNDAEAAAPEETAPPEEAEEPPEEEPSSEEAAEESSDGGAGIELGVITDGTYENRSLGVGLSLDESWTYASDDAIRAMNGDVNIINGLLNGEDIRDLMEETTATVIYAMFAEKEDALANLSLNFEYLGAVYGSLMDEEDYLSMSVASVENAMEAMGAFSDYTIEEGTVVLAGEERPALRIHGVILGEQDYYQTLTVMKTGQFMAVFTLTSLLEDTTDEIAEYFYALD